MGGVLIRRDLSALWPETVSDYYYRISAVVRPAGNTGEKTFA
jgi:hypothetical protein